MFYSLGHNRLACLAFLVAVPAIAAFDPSDSANLGAIRNSLGDVLGSDVYNIRQLLYHDVPIQTQCLGSISNNLFTFLSLFDSVLNPPSGPNGARSVRADLDFGGYVPYVNPDTSYDVRTSAQLLVTNVAETAQLNRIIELLEHGVPTGLGSSISDQWIFGQLLDYIDNYNLQEIFMNNGFFWLFDFPSINWETGENLDYAALNYQYLAGMYGSWRWRMYESFYRLSLNYLTGGDTNRFAQAMALTDFSNTENTLLREVFSSSYFNQYSTLPSYLLVSNYLGSIVSDGVTNSAVLSAITDPAQFQSFFNSPEFTNTLSTVSSGLVPESSSFATFQTNGVDVVLPSMTEPINLADIEPVTNNQYTSPFYEMVDKVVSQTRFNDVFKTDLDDGFGALDEFSELKGSQQGILFTGFKYGDHTVSDFYIYPRYQELYDWGSSWITLIRIFMWIGHVYIIIYLMEGFLMPGRDRYITPSGPGGGLQMIDVFNDPDD